MKKSTFFAKTQRKYVCCCTLLLQELFWKKHWMECETIERNVPRFKKSERGCFIINLYPRQKTEINLFFEDLETRSIWILCVSFFHLRYFNILIIAIFDIHPKKHGYGYGRRGCMIFTTILTSVFRCRKLGNHSTIFLCA